MLYLCLFASLSLMSCSQDENMPSENNNDDKEFVVTVDFTVSGVVDYGESNQPSTRSTASPVKKVIPLNEDFEAEVTLTPDVPVQTRSAAPTPVKEGVHFRVLAYKGNTYAGHADYKIEDGMVKPVGTEALILYNNTYKFIAYSYNNGSYLPEWDPANPNLPINAEEHDFLHWTEDITLDQQEEKLPIVFSHLLPHFKLKLDTSEMLGLECFYASAALKPALAPIDGGFIPKSGIWNPLTHNDDNNGAGFIPDHGNDSLKIEISPSEMLKSHEYVFFSDPKILFPISNKGLNLTLNFGFGSYEWRPGEKAEPTQKLEADLQLGQHTFLSGRSYTCLVKIKPSNMRLVPNHDPDNSIHLYNALTSSSSYYYINVESEGSGTSDPLGYALHGGSGMSPTEVVVLWEETDPANSELPLIPGIRYLKNERQIIMAVNGRVAGNAVIAAIDGGGDVIWSWHIWVDYAPEYFNYNFKPFNVGATKSNPTGLLFQYGRKDPLRKTDIQRLDRGTVTPADAYKLGISNPMHFITNWDWSSNSNYWSGTGTYKYNPCPAGTRLPTYDEFRNGFISSDGEGYIDGDGNFHDVEGGYWTNTPGKIYVPSTGEHKAVEDRAAAYPIRCIKYK